MPTAKNGYLLPDGTALPSVTTILQAVGWGKEGLMYWAWDLGRKGFDYKDLRDQAASIGTIVHDRIHADLLGLEWDEAGFEPKHIVASDEPFEVYQAWRKENEIEIIMAEENITSATLGFGGTPDYLCLLNGRVVLIDAKTSSSIYETHIMQAAAYGRLIETERPEAISSRGRTRIEATMILQVGKDGSFRPKMIDQDILEVGWHDFLHAKAIFENRAAYKEVCKRPTKKRAKKKVLIEEDADAMGE